MGKKIIVTKNQLQQIIKEGVAKLHKKNILENRIQQIKDELKSINEVFYGDSDGDYDFDKSQGAEADDLYDKGRELFNQGDIYGAKEMRRQALEKGSWLGWGESEFPPYADDTKKIDNMDFLSENNEVASAEVMSILNNYLEAALWTEEEDIGQANLSDISNDSKIVAYKDIKNFLDQAGNLVDGIDPEQIGHDLWLSRNGHGAGFFDRELGDIGNTLQDIAKEMGERYVGWSDGEIVIE